MSKEIYSERINTEVITLDELLQLYETKNQAVILHNGKIEDFCMI